jgi:hypothetical protein
MLLVVKSCYRFFRIELIDKKEEKYCLTHCFFFIKKQYSFYKWTNTNIDFFIENNVPISNRRPDFDKKET